MTKQEAVRLLFFCPFALFLNWTYFKSVEGTDHYHITYPERVDGNRDKRDLSTFDKIASWLSEKHEE